MMLTEGLIIRDSLSSILDEMFMRHMERSMERKEWFGKAVDEIR
jgi:hypothetical protein